MALIVINQDIYLGNVPRGTIKEFTFDLTNNSSYPIAFNCSVSCGCTLPVFETQFMSAFSMQYPKVMLDTSNFGIGSFNKTIAISYTNSDSEEPTQERIIIKIKGETI